MVQAETFQPIQAEAALDDDLQECIDDCQETHEASIEMVPYLLAAGGDLASPGLVRLISDLSEITQTHGNFLLRGSDLSEATARACREVCLRVVRAAQEFDDEEVAEFRQIVEACADSCGRLAGADA